MPRGQLRNVVDYLRGMVSGRAIVEDTDGELLERFVRRKDEAAFEALLRRHGPMVLGVCRRVLGDIHDAEDAFQIGRQEGQIEGRKTVIGMPRLEYPCFSEYKGAVTR
jgi:hypothetical protein